MWGGWKFGRFVWFFPWRGSLCVRTRFLINDAYFSSSLISLRLFLSSPGEVRGFCLKKKTKKKKEKVKSKFLTSVVWYLGQMEGGGGWYESLCFGADWVNLARKDNSTKQRLGRSRPYHMLMFYLLGGITRIPALSRSRHTSSNRVWSWMFAQWSTTSEVIWLHFILLHFIIILVVMSGSLIADRLDEHIRANRIFVKFPIGSSVERSGSNKTFLVQGLVNQLCSGWDWV